MEESAEAPPAAEEARRFRGSVPTAGHGSGWEPADTTVSAGEKAKKITTRIGVLWGSRTVTKMPAPWLGSPLANATVPRTVAPSFGTLRACEAGVRFEPLWTQLQKRKTPMWVSFFFVIAHRFCCLHSRTSQGRGSVRGEPLTGSPTRVQSPARRRPLLRSKSAAPKRKHHPDGWCFFLERATRKAPKRRLRRKKRGGFEEVSRLPAAAAAGSRLTRR